eukprot:gene18308-biopygen18893
MKTVVKLIRSPQAGKDQYEVKKLRDGQEVRRRWATRDDAFVQRDRVEKHLSRLGLFRNEKKGHWEPTQLAKHLGLEVDFKEGLFRVTEARLKKIHAKATGLICRAARDQRWVQARELAGFNGLYQSVFLAVLAARLYLRELYFVLGKKSWGSKMKLTRQAWGDLQWCEANEWADRLSRDKDLDDWRIKGRWFKYAEENWGEHSADRFASGISAQLPSLVSHPQLPVSCHLRGGGVVTGQTDIKKYGETTIKYDDRDVEELVLEEERYRVPRSVTTEGQQQEVRPTPWRAALLQHWTGELGDNKYSDTAAAMQASALQRLTADNYGRHWEKFMKFCGEHGLQWLPASATTVQLYVASLLESGTGPAKGRAVTRAVKGMTAMQTEAAEQQDITETTADRHGDAERESLLRDSKGLSIVLEKEKGKNHLLCIPKEGVAEPHELLDQWEQARDDE